ncbi:MAG: alanine racemase [Victivallaceae bacterium]|nr:alanine racemase [Victivallaceae bacterium]
MFYSWVEVNLNALRENINIIREAMPHNCKLLLPLKANAYGHGLEPMAKAAHEFGVEWLGLATLREGLEIKAYVPEARILVLGPCVADDVKALYVHGITPIIVDLENALQLNEAARKMHIKLTAHIIVDTGMGRIGFDAEHKLDDIYKVTQLSNLEIEGLMSHYASADEIDSKSTIGQLDKFRRVSKFLREREINIKLKHISNSGGFLNIAHSDFDMVRPGILLYGGLPPEDGKVRKGIRTKPLLSWKTNVTFIKEAFPGQRIGYGSEYTIKKHTKIATIEVGYGDGFLRNLSDCAELIIRGDKYPVVGRISMDQTTVDIGLYNSVCVGDEVVIMGKQGLNEISANDIAEKMDTISYEVFTLISDRVERRYIFNGEQVHRFVFSNFSLMAGTILGTR